MDLNDYADKDDIIYITYRINGGFNGYIEDRKPKLIQMIKNSVRCINSNYMNYDQYSIKKSQCWELHDPLYLYAVLNTSESRDCYKQYLNLTNDYLNWPSIKGWESDKSGSKKKKKEKVEKRRSQAKSKN